VRRRELLALLGWAGHALPTVGVREISSKTALLAVLTARPPDSMRRYIRAFDEGMLQAGYVRGRDYEITLRSTESDATRAPALLAELIGLKPRAILTSDTPLTLAAKRVTNEIPIIGVGIFNPVGFGLVQSIAHPGGNVTGLLSSVDRLVAKQLELLLQTVPGRTRIGILANVNNPANMAGVRFVQNDAALRSLRFVPAEIGQLSEIEPAFRRFVDNHVEAMLVMQDALFNANARQVAALALAARLPTVTGFGESAEAGGLMSYGLDLIYLWRRAAALAAKIINGANPADLPVELQPRLALVINLKTAKALDITVPPSILAFANDVIE
jgi:putative tryptophan/tyrosine transport system substrate-binding protein